MNTEEIDHILSRGITRKFYRGTFPEDVDFHFTPPYCVVTNCDSHNGKGSHWNAWFVDESKIYFFDSYGRSPKDDTFPLTYKMFVKNRKFVYNPRIVEGMFSTMCGQFCIYVLHFLCQGYEWKTIVDSFDNSVVTNDKKMKYFVTKLRKNL